MLTNDHENTPEIKQEVKTKNCRFIGIHPFYLKSNNIVKNNLVIILPFLFPEDRCALFW